MTRSTFRDAIRFAQYLNATTVEFCGGEPLLYKDLPWAVRTAERLGFRRILRTNGLFLPTHRFFVADNFQSVGISLDGDERCNNLMRPAKDAALSPQKKLQIPLHEIAAIKSINSHIYIVLASVATKINTDGLMGLATILVSEQIPLNIWKIYQFVPNNFRAKRNRQEFSLSATAFQKLSSDLTTAVKGAFPLVCRKCEEIDGSCIVVSRNGDVLLGSIIVGNVSTQSPESLGAVLRTLGAATKVSINKSITYENVFWK